MATAKEKSVFEILNGINVNEHTEKKNGLTYLSWAWAWAEIKKKFPDANYRVYENDNGFNYFTDGKTCWVKTSVTINDLEHVDYLPVMDYKNKSIPWDIVTSFDVNKTIQRSLTRACARHGLGLYIYAGEDIPEGETPTQAPAPQAAPVFICERCGKAIGSHGKNSASQVATVTKKLFKKQMCYECGQLTKREMEIPAPPVPSDDEPTLPFPIPD